VHTFHYATRVALLVSAAAFTSFAAPAMAQETEVSTDGYEGDFPDDFIVVTGSIRQSQQAAIEEKRAAPNLIDVASADSVGRFPDENIAAALTRLPGVAVQRDQGQARYIQVRGAPNRWTSVSINGIPQTGTDEGGTGRAFRFDAVPSVILEQLVINKSLTPDITAEAVTANVDLVTYSALDRGGLHVSGDLGYGWMELGDGDQRQGSLRASYGGDTWGIVVGGSHYIREQVTDNREYGYSIGSDGELAPKDYDVRNYKLDRTTNGLFAGIEVEPTANLRVYLNGIYTEFMDDEQRNAYEFEIQDGLGTRTKTGGDLVNVPISGTFNDGKYRTRNYVFAAGVDYEGDNFGVDVAAGYTRNENSTYLPLTLTKTSEENNVSLTYDATDPQFVTITGLYGTLFDTDSDGNLINPRRGAPITQVSSTGFNAAGTYIYPIVTSTVSDSYTGKADAYYDFDGDWMLRFGAQFQKRDIDGNVANFTYFPIAPYGFDVNAYATNTPWSTGFPLGATINYVNDEQLNLDQEAILKEQGLDYNDTNAPSDFFSQSEDIWAGYVSGEWEFGDLQVVAGARAEYYEITSKGTANIDGTLTPLTVSQDYFDIFPSVNLRYNVTDDVVVRLAGLRGTARPAYAALRVGSSINDTSETVSAGNPGLRPEYTWGADASIEYYLPSNGIVSISGFYRYVEDVLYGDSRPVGTDVFNSGGVDRSGYMLGAQFNGLDGKVMGVELNLEHQFDFLPGPLSGFGVQGNVTFLDGDFDAMNAAGVVSTLPFPGLSDTIVNTAVFYEKYGLSARVSYQWRSDYIDTIGGLGIGDGEFRGAYENLDVTLRYAVNEHLTVYADLANLTDEIYTAYDGDPSYPTEVEQIGSRYMFGIRFDF
tara:strand:+ start:43378 stop:46005 length:2628 start_codon:yes stop_codon:yes gene_type:complete